MCHREGSVKNILTFKLLKNYESISEHFSGGFVPDVFYKDI